MIFKIGLKKANRLKSGKMPASRRRKIRPLRKVPPTRIKNPDREFVYLENDRLGVRIPLRNRHGLLNGVFETRDGQVLEIRFLGTKYVAFIGNQSVGEVTLDLDHRDVNSSFKRQGVATELFDLAERQKARLWWDQMKIQKGSGSSRHRVFQRETMVHTNKKDAAAFLVKRGYKPNFPEDVGRVNVIQKIPSIQPEQYIQSLFLSKWIEGSAFDDPQKWHRIKVMGRNSAPKWLTIRVLPSHALPFSP